VSKPLPGKNTICECDVDIAVVRSHENLVGLDGRTKITERYRISGVGFLLSDRHRFQPLGHPAHGADAVFDPDVVLTTFRAVPSAPQGEIAPVCFLDGPHAGILLLPSLVILPLKGHPGRKTPLLPRTLVDPDDIEAKAAGNDTIDVP
jgi:hypothetical protein